MKIGIIGLGRMGMAIAERLINHNHIIFGYDNSNASAGDARKIGVTIMDNVRQLAAQADAVWLMVPVGKPVDDVLATILPHLHSSSIVIDGGNSFFKDSIRRHSMLAAHGIAFLDCGTSGGLHGRQLGFSLMVGGQAAAFAMATPVFQAIAAPDGYAHVGPAGTGHYVKMVHNGIEYALLQGYAEGFHLLREGSDYKDLNLAQIAHVWNNGAIIRSWICQLAEDVFKHDQALKDISGAIGQNLTGQWTVDTARDNNIPTPTIKQALDVRAWSHTTGGNYATKVVAMLRNAFGGHAVKKV